MEKKIQKSTLLILCCCLLSALFVGCDQSEWLIQTGDTAVEQGLFTYYMIQSYDEAYLSLDDSELELWENTVEGVPVQEWMQEQAIQKSKRYLSISVLYDESNLSFNQNDEEDIEKMVYQEYWLDGLREFLGPLGIDQDLYKNIVTCDKKADKLIEYYTNQLEKDVNDETIQSILEADYASFSFISILKYDTENKEDMAEYTNDLLRQIKNGENTMDHIIDQFKDDERQIIQTSYNDNRYDVATRKDNILSFPKEFLEQIFDTAIGDVFLYDDTANQSLNIVKRTDILSDRYFIEKLNDDITSQLLEEGFEKILSQEISSMEFEINQKNINKYDLQSILSMET